MIVKVRSHTVYQQKDGKFKCEIWYYDENGETRRKTFTDKNKEVVEVKSSRFLTENRKGEMYPNCTVSEYFEAAVLPELKLTAKNTAYLKNIEMFRNRIEPHIGSVKMDMLKKAKIEKTLNIIADTYSEGVLKDCYRLIKRIIEHYVKTKDLDKDPMKGIKCPESKIEKSVKKQYTPDEIERILKIADSINLETNRPKYMHGNAVKLMLLTDMKIGEALALTWNDIDFKNGTITVNKTSSEINLSKDGKKDYSIKFKPLSSRKARIISITSEIQTVLKSMRKNKVNSNLVISQKNGDPVSKSYISRVMRGCVKEACG